jgi:hypothetical protein
MIGSVAKSPKITTMTTAALVITPAVPPTPSATACRVGSPRSWPSRIWLSTNT